MDYVTFKALLGDVIAFVEERLLHECSLYRIPGSDVEAHNFLSRYKRGTRPSLKELADPFTATTLLKYAIKALDPPLLSREIYPALKAALYLKEKLNRCPPRAITGIYDRLLTADQRYIFEKLAAHFYKVAEEPENQMTLVNLVTVFGPTCVISYEEETLEEMRASPGILLLLIQHAAQKVGIVPLS